MEAIKNKCMATFLKVIIAGLILFSGGFPIWQTHAAGGELWAWGMNSQYQANLGLGDYVSRYSPTQVAPGTTWASIEASFLSTYGIKPDGSLWAWGINGYSWGGSTWDELLGLDSSYGTNVTSPAQVAPGTNWASVAAVTGGYWTAAIKTDGTLWAWGNNYGGQLGLGYTSRNVATPTRVGSATNWRSVSAGYYHFMGIKTDGTLWAWGGSDAYGALGLGAYNSGQSASYYYSPHQVGTATNWRSVQPAYHSTVALKTDGTLWAWGANQFGQLGLGCYTGQTGCPSYVGVPTQVGTGTNWASISTKSQFVAAIKTDGTLWTWGTNIYGELGNGTGGSYNGALSPTQVGSDTHWASVSGSDWPQNSVAAIKTDGTLWTWGANQYYGTLGLGYSGGNVYTPTQVGTRTDWGSVSMGTQDAMAIGVTPGVCGENINGSAAYAADDVAPTDWATGFCSAGAPSATPGFPAPSDSVTWNCNTTPCVAIHLACTSSCVANITACSPSCGDGIYSCDWQLPDCSISNVPSLPCNNGACPATQDANWREVSPN